MLGLFLGITLGLFALGYFLDGVFKAILWIAGGVPIIGIFVCVCWDIYIKGCSSISEIGIWFYKCEVLLVAAGAIIIILIQLIKSFIKNKEPDNQNSSVDISDFKEV